MSTKIRTTEKYRGYSRVHGADEYFESGGRGHNIYFTTKYRGQQRIFFLCYLKNLGGCTQFLLHRNSTRQVYSSQLEVT
jgi:hypothetical protein